MTLSVGLGRITNDPEAPIRTRKALGRLATPGLLVTDKGLTIDTNGRIVLRLASAGGLSEDSNGLALKLAPGSGLSATSDGLGLDGDLTDFGDITCNSITVDTNAIVTGNVNVSGNVTADGILTSSSANIVGAINSVSLAVTNSITSATVGTGAITCSTITASGGINAVSVILSGSVSAPSGSLIGGSATIIGNASVGGTLTVGAFSPSSISTGAITCSTVTTSGNVSVGGALTAGSSLNVNSGTTITNIRSFFVTCAVPAAFGTLDFHFALGASTGDTLICNPLTLPNATFDAWSASLDGSNVVIRILRDTSASLAHNIDFRVTLIRFA